MTENLNMQHEHEYYIYMCVYVCLLNVKSLTVKQGKAPLKNDVQLLHVANKIGIPFTIQPRVVFFRN